MELKIPIENLLIVKAPGAEAAAGALEAFIAALGSDEGANVRDLRKGGSGDTLWVRFGGEWDPPFRPAKKTSGAYADVTVTLYSDAFAKHHWLSKAEYVGGKGNELTLSRVDDEFDGVFAEIYGKDLASWEAAPTAPFAGY